MKLKMKYCAEKFAYSSCQRRNQTYNLYFKDDT